MATVLVNNDNSMIVTIPERIMQHSKNIHTITIFVPQMYEGYDMSEFAAYIEIVPPNPKYRSNHLDANEVSRKEGFLQFDFEITSDLTLFSGNISMEMTFVKTDEDTYKTYIRHTTSCSLLVTPIEKWSELIIDDALTDLDQRIALIEQGIKVASNLADKINSTKADNIKLDKETSELYLTANDNPIGDKITINELGDTLAEQTKDGLVPIIL